MWLGDTETKDHIEVDDRGMLLCGPRCEQLLDEAAVGLKLGLSVWKDEETAQAMTKAEGDLTLHAGVMTFKKPNCSRDGESADTEYTPGKAWSNWIRRVSKILSESATGSIAES